MWTTAKSLWSWATGEFIAPKVDPEEVEHLLEKVRAELPTPVFWLLGKTQSGKSSIIRAMTGSTRAEIGNGFRPCTRTAQQYPFPDEADPLIRFLDTRGLGEVDYDPQEDLDAFQEKAHVLLVVMAANDHAQQPIMEALRKIHDRRPDYPIVVAQTCLHFAYDKPLDAHVMPYPYPVLETSQDWTPPAYVPNNLARSLASQRSMFKGISAHFVPIDFTLPEDGFEPQWYGLDALTDAIEAALPMGLRAMLASMAETRAQFRDVYFRAAHPHVVSYAAAAGAAAAVPVPLVDLPLVAAIQFKMAQAIASIYNQNLSRERLREIIGGLGLAFITRLGFRELLKFIPGVGSVVSAAYASASTYALGRTLCAYFSYGLHGDMPEPGVFQKIYKDELEEAKTRFRDYVQHVGQKQKGPSA